LSLFGLGAIILTRVGTRDYPEGFASQSFVANESIASHPIRPIIEESGSDDHEDDDLEKLKNIN